MNPDYFVLLIENLTTRKSAENATAIKAASAKSTPSPFQELRLLWDLNPQPVAICP
jgi:hypothetical protein